MEQRRQRCNKNTLQHAIGPFLVLSQFLGVFPVSGVWPSSPVENVRFRWLSASLVLSVVILAFAIMDLGLSSKVVIDHGLKIYTIGSLSFSVICIACLSIFLSLAYRWPYLIRRTAQCELVFLQPDYDCHLGRQFGRRLRLWGVGMLLAALCEHFTYVGSALYGNYQQIHECKLDVDFWLNYFQRERQELFSVFHFNVPQALFIEWTTLAMTFVWNFVDIFLTLICRGLQFRFRQMHWRIRRHSTQQMPSEFWEQLRYDLLDLCDLLRLYDKELSGMVVLACSHNMYFVCVQIYHSFKARGSFMDELYFWFCLIYVIARVSNMMFAASSIPQEARQISYTLFEIPTEYWCLELCRIQEIILTNRFALSGKGYFFLTRRLIFSVSFATPLALIYPRPLADGRHADGLRAGANQSNEWLRGADEHLQPRRGRLQEHILFIVVH
ncbi:gustatory receptor for sugar taste 64c isoform X1 [Drosophila navojoa]|uniref:gustatory receptor for sugar taste 64c isoform X1 n=1 Tax=Drosophila navojoa TaxID=7232 RepID=UPI0011BD6F07|nr:gustatory receptor for sugar taste 64c isoform X1 [Drosophila navojoa]